MPGPSNHVKRRKNQPKIQKCKPTECAKSTPPSSLQAESPVQKYRGPAYGPLCSMTNRDIRRNQYDYDDHMHTNLGAGGDENYCLRCGEDTATPPSGFGSQLLTPSPPPRRAYPITSSPKKRGGDVRELEDCGLHSFRDQYEEEDQTEPAFQMPFIYDPGNGPRVRDARAFLNSKFFAQPPAQDDPLCAEFAQEEILEMLETVLPEETALILWYNKSRATSRICPACQRLYRLGDVLPDHITEDEGRIYKRPSPQLAREQELSGLCSPVCFVLASFNYPGAIKSAWGRMEDEMDDVTWTLLNGPGEGKVQSELGNSLSLLVRMTRLPDLGLAQLCFGSEASLGIGRPP